MCTLTFIPRIARGPAAPPARMQSGTVTAIYPRDVEGGTWIGVNEQGMAFALLNWNRHGASTEKTRSRGEIIPALVSLSSFDELQISMRDADLHGLLPFRLVAISPLEKKVAQWRWDQRTRLFQAHEWKPRHWFSSSLSDDLAELQRGAVCRAAWGEPAAGSLPWLRRLHASHEDGPRPFSICVHREYVRTLSYTEMVCTRQRVSTYYVSGSPCETRLIAHSLGIARQGSSADRHRSGADYLRSNCLDRIVGS